MLQKQVLLLVVKPTQKSLKYLLFNDLNNNKMEQVNIFTEQVRQLFRIHSDGTWQYRNIILHVPHSSTKFPPNSSYTFNHLDEEERLLIDYYTDELFVPLQESEHISSLVFPFCRLYCDVERLINDPLEKEGLGISYQRWVNGVHGKRTRSFGSKTDAFIMYSAFHEEAANRMAELEGSRILIDCHSFSALPNLLNSNPPDIDICIGYNDDETCPDKVVIGNIVHHFESLGYKLGINEPFSNSKTFAVPVK